MYLYVGKQVVFFDYFLYFECCCICCCVVNVSVVMLEEVVVGCDGVVNVVIYQCCVDWLIFVVQVFGNGDYVWYYVIFFVCEEVVGMFYVGYYFIEQQQYVVVVVYCVDFVEVVGYGWYGVGGGVYYCFCDEGCDIFCVEFDDFGVQFIGEVLYVLCVVFVIQLFVICIVW